MMKAGFALRGRNPDVLTCIANLSNDEVFTPPEFASGMLDALAEAWAADNFGASIWADPNVTFLDPFTKTGVFLREITRRLTAGLEGEIPNLADRVDHILTNQVFGIGITKLTSLIARRSLYCSKFADGPHSIARSFTTEAGNIWFERLEHTWVNDRCKFCGASRGALDRGEGFESYAYALIHTDDIKSRTSELFGGMMQFDVIIGNPPYQLASDGGTRDVPIYHRFFEQAKALEPRYITVVIPSRWMASGLGLSDFRKSMLGDRRIRKLVDYPVASEVFPGVEIKGGVCYLLWVRDNEGDCDFTSVRGDDVVGPIARDLREFDVLVRDSRALGILRKVQAQGEPSIIEILSVDKEFGWTSNFDGFHRSEQPGDIPIYYGRQGKRFTGWIDRSEVLKSEHLIDTWKVMVPQAGSDGGQRLPDAVLGKPFVVPSPSVCTQTFLFFFLTKQTAAESLESYLRTRFMRFLVSLRKITQHATRSTYTWVPIQEWNRRWTDTALYEKYGLSDEEIAYIEAVIKPMEPDGERTV